MNFEEVEKYLYARIKDKLDIGYNAGIGLERVKYTLYLLGNPQEKFKSIHIAGTSGKGSTAKFISEILVAHGFKTGLTLSPHILDIRERVQIQNKLISKPLFAKHFNSIVNIFSKVENSKYGPLSYFEMIICLAFFTFAKEEVDYAVIETGLGGTYDATNSIIDPNKVCVITTIGFDHMKILGNTLVEIAENKAGIINTKQFVLFNSSTNINNVITKRCQETFSKWIEIREGFIPDELKMLNIKILPSYQVQNFIISVQTIKYLSTRDRFKFQIEYLIDIVKNYRFIGRFEEIEFNSRKIILDGAHNTQKMLSFTESLTKKFPNTKFTFVLAFKQDKEVKKMLENIHPIANKFYLTEFHTTGQDLNHSSFNLNLIRKILLSQNFKGDIILEKNIKKILDNESQIIDLKQSPLVFTGSLYLVGYVKSIINKLQQ